MKLVMLPGLDGTGDLFRPFAAALPDSISPDIISYPSTTPLGYAQLLEWVRERLPREPLALLGESFGGPLALKISAECPPQLRAVMFAGSFATCPYRFVPTWLARCVRPLPFRAMPPLAKLWRALGGYESDDDFALSYGAIAQVSAQVFAHRVQEIVRVDVTAELATCAVPMLYLQGERDRVVRPHNYERMRRIKPALRLARIDAGHMILKTRPHLAARAVESFLTEIGPPSDK